MSTYKVKDCAQDFAALCEAGGPLELLADHVRDGDPDGVLVDGVHFDDAVMARLAELPEAAQGHVTTDPDGTRLVWFRDDSGSTDPLGFEVFMQS